MSFSGRVKYCFFCLGASKFLHTWLWFPPVFLGASKFNCRLFVVFFFNSRGFHPCFLGDFFFCCAPTQSTSGPSAQPLEFSTTQGGTRTERHENNWLVEFLADLYWKLYFYTRLHCRDRNYVLLFHILGIFMNQPA